MYKYSVTVSRRNIALQISRTYSSGMAEILCSWGSNFSFLSLSSLWQPAFFFFSVPMNLIKNLPAVQEIRVQSLGGEDPLEKEMATHLGVLAWRTPWTKEPDGLQPMGSQRVGRDLSDEHCRFHFLTPFQ